jgi:hypothetical protein
MNNSGFKQNCRASHRSTTSSLSKGKSCHAKRSVLAAASAQRKGQNTQGIHFSATVS